VVKPAGYSLDQYRHRVSDSTQLVESEACLGLRQPRLGGISVSPWLVCRASGAVRSEPPGGPHGWELAHKIS